MVRKQRTALILFLSSISISSNKNGAAVSQISILQNVKFISQSYFDVKSEINYRKFERGKPIMNGRRYHPDMSNDWCRRVFFLFLKMDVRGR